MRPQQVNRFKALEIGAAEAVSLRQDDGRQFIGLGQYLRPRLVGSHDKPECAFGYGQPVRVSLGGRRVLAVSGLADPSAFYAMLRELDAELVGVFEYPDHHAYTNADWQAIVNAMRDTDLVVTTEKDLVKLERFPFPRDSLYALKLEVTMDAADTRALDELIMGRMTAARAANA